MLYNSIKSRGFNYELADFQIGLHSDGCLLNLVVLVKDSLRNQIFAKNTPNKTFHDETHTQKKNLSDLIFFWHGFIYGRMDAEAVGSGVRDAKSSVHRVTADGRPSLLLPPRQHKQKPDSSELNT